MIKTKTFDIKADNLGAIVGYASTWTREPDSYGDVVAKGAFAECIARLKEEGRNIPLLWNHAAMDLKAFIGTVTDLAEDDHGLKFEADFDGTEEAQRARQLAQDGRLCKFSFAYDVLEAGEITLEDGRKANELRKLNIHEVSFVMYPANADTSVVSVKSGRRNSKSDEDIIKQIISLANQLLDDEIDDRDEDPSGSEAKAEEPDTVNAKEQKRREELLEHATKLLEEVNK